MDVFVRSCVAKAAPDRRGLSHQTVLAACLAISLIFLLLPLAAIASGGSLIPFEQRYRIIADDALRDSVSSRAERVVAVEPGMTVTSIARTSNGKWLKVRLDDRGVTGFIQSRRLERIAGDSRDEVLAGMSSRSSSASGLSLTELTRSGEIKQRHYQNQVERERQRRLAEQRRLEEEQRRLEAEQQAMEQELAEQREMQRRQISSNDDGVNWEGVVQGLQIFTEMTNLQMEQQRRQAQQQLEQRQAMLQEADERKAAQRRRIEVRQRDLQRRQQAVHEEKRIAEELQRQIARRIASSGNSGSTYASRGGAASPVSAGARHSPSGKQGGADSSSGRSKIYEPMMETALGENSDWFSDRSMAVFYARLSGVNDISGACRDRGSRVDRPTTDQLKSGDAPMRWSFGSPQCRQGGWNDAEWSCRTEMAGTCWRRN